MARKNKDPKVSTIELYRHGLLSSPAYDMGDPLDVAIFAALQSYVDLLERLDVARRQKDKKKRKEANLYQHKDILDLNLRSAGFLEDGALKLKAWNKGELDLGPEDRFETARSLLEAFFSPARNLQGKLVPWGYGDYYVDRTLWEAGEEILEGERETDDAGGLLELAQWDTAHHFRILLAPFYALLIRALGGLITQSEAARRLDLTARGVATRVGRGEMRHVRIGGSVLIPEADVGVNEEERLRTTGRET